MAKYYVTATISGKIEIDPEYLDEGVSISIKDMLEDDVQIVQDLIDAGYSIDKVEHKEVTVPSA